MKHYGDVTKLRGDKLTPVNIISDGSPCQDFSVAGRRAGMQDEEGELTRSGLYMESCRIIREMLLHTGGKFPRFHVWENVQGALTSGRDANGKKTPGSDFAAVLEETIRAKYPNIPPIPIPKDGWPNAGYITVNDMSVAWRLHNGQFWGLPQRRRRLCVLTDYQSFKAAELLFGGMKHSAEYQPPKGKKAGAICLTLSPTLYSPDDYEWLEDEFFPIYNFNVTEHPDCGQTKLWGRDTGRYTDTESLLSNVLEDNVDPKYQLSARACRGILNRAERRGKVLPEELRIALEQQIERLEAGENDTKDLDD